MTGSHLGLMRLAVPVQGWCLKGSQDWVNREGRSLRGRGTLCMDNSFWSVAGKGEEGFFLKNPDRSEPVK